MSNKISRSIFNVIKTMSIIFIAVIMLAPFYWMITTSFKSSTEAIQSPPTFIPQNSVGFENYYRVFTEIPFFRYFINSVIVSVTVTTSVVVTSAVAGYIFAKLEFFGRDQIFFFIIATMMIPFPVLLIPMFMIVTNLQLANTLPALMLPYLVNAFGIFLMRQFFISIPTEYIEAGRIDGASEFRIFWLVLPLCTPAISALAVFIFLLSWDDFLWPLVVIEENIRRTLPLGLALFRQQFGPLDWNLIHTGAVLAAIPVIVLFLFLQRTFIHGITMTGLKG